MPSGDSCCGYLQAVFGAVPDGETHKQNNHLSAPLLASDHGLPMQTMNRPQSTFGEKTPKGPKEAELITSNLQKVFFFTTRNQLCQVNS
jgi:hypothetical protein